MQERHTNRKLYWEEQATTTSKFVIPFITDDTGLDKNSRILEIGCGEGGNLKPFLDKGCEVVGIDLNEAQLKRAAEYFSGHQNIANLKLMFNDIYKVDPASLGKFDFIIMRDVIEHIHNQEKFMNFVKVFLKPTGKFFLGFPPWYMPFGGHQQICKSKLLSKTPYFHLLPNFLYKGLLSTFGENEHKIESLMEIKETGISIERFNRILKKEKYQIDKKVFYLINPNYETKFNLKPRVLPNLLGKIPFFRNFITTCSYYLISFP